MKNYKKLIVIVAILTIVVLIGTMSAGCKKAEAAGGVFRAFIVQPVSLDPPFCYESEGIQVIRQVWDGLFDYDRKTLELKNELCDSYEVSDDGLVYTFKLKKGVKWHDGSALTAEDFVYSWTRIALAETAAPLAYHLGPILGFDACQEGTSTTLEGVKALDELTLEVTLSYPYADFITTLGHTVFYPVKKADVEQWGADYTKHINGTGPFKFVEWIDDQHVSLVRNDDYYGTKALLDSVEYVIIADEDTAFLEFKAGNLEFTQIPIGKIKSTVEEYPDSSFTDPFLGIYYYGMYMAGPPFADNPKLREAMNYIIDRDNICDVLNEGIPKPMTGFIPPGIPGFQENAATYTYDPEKAKELLAEAGYPDGEGLPTLVWAYNTGSGHEVIGEAVQADFAAVGINMELEGYEWGTMLEKAKAGEFAFFRLGWQADYPTMDNFLYPLFYSESYDNYAAYSNPEVDQMLLEARSILDEDERIAKYQEIEKKILADNAFVLIYFYGSRRVAQPYVKGFELDAMENYDLSTVYFEKE